MFRDLYGTKVKMKFFISFIDADIAKFTTGGTRKGNTRISSFLSNSLCFYSDHDDHEGNRVFVQWQRPKRLQH